MSGEDRIVVSGGGFETSVPAKFAPLAKKFLDSRIYILDIFDDQENPKIFTVVFEDNLFPSLFCGMIIDSGLWKDVAPDADVDDPAINCQLSVTLGEDGPDDLYFLDLPVDSLDKVSQLLEETAQRNADIIPNVLLNGAPAHRGDNAPQSVWDGHLVPLQPQCEHVEVGDQVKLSFHAPTPVHLVESMWVVVTDHSLGNFEGKLMSDPISISNLKKGAVVYFKLHQIIDVVKVGTESSTLLN